MGFHDVISFYNKEKYKKLNDLRQEEQRLNNEIGKTKKRLQKERTRLNKK